MSTNTETQYGVLPSVRALISDVANLQNETQVLDGKLWNAQQEKQQTMARLGQAEQVHSQTLKTLRQTRDELQRLSSELINEKEQHHVIKKSLEFEFAAHGKTEARLQQEYELNHRIIAFLNSHVRTQSNEQSEDIGLGSALVENHALMKGLETTNLELQYARDQLGEKQQLLEQKERELEALKEELTSYCSDEECGKE